MFCRLFPQLLRGSSNPSVHRAWSKTQKSADSFQRPTQSKSKHDHWINGSVEPGQFLLEPCESFVIQWLPGFGDGSRKGLSIPRASLTAKQVIGTTDGDGAKPGSKLAFSVHDRNGSDGSDHCVLHHIETKRLFAAGGPLCYGENVVEPFAIETRERLGISRSDRGCQVLYGFAQWTFSR